MTPFYAPFANLFLKCRVVQKGPKTTLTFLVFTPLTHTKLYGCDIIYKNIWYPRLPLCSCILELLAKYKPLIFLS